MIELDFRVRCVRTAWSHLLLCTAFSGSPTALGTTAENRFDGPWEVEPETGCCPRWAGVQDSLCITAKKIHQLTRPNVTWLSTMKVYFLTTWLSNLRAVEVSGGEVGSRLCSTQSFRDPGWLWLCYHQYVVSKYVIVISIPAQPGAEQA